MKTKTTTMDYLPIDLVNVLKFGEELIPELLDIVIASVKHALIRKYGKAVYYSKKDVNIKLVTVYYNGIPSELLDTVAKELRISWEDTRKYVEKYNIPKGVKVILYAWVIHRNWLYIITI